MSPCHKQSRNEPFSDRNSCYIYLASSIVAFPPIYHNKLPVCCEGRKHALLYSKLCWELMYYYIFIRMNEYFIMSSVKFYLGQLCLLLQLFFVLLNDKCFRSSGFAFVEGGKRKKYRMYGKLLVFSQKFYFRNVHMILDCSCLSWSLIKTFLLDRSEQCLLKLSYCTILHWIFTSQWFKSMCVQAKIRVFWWRSPSGY